MEVKGQEMNKAIYGDSDKGSVRGIPGQVLVNKYITIFFFKF